MPETRPAIPIRGFVSSAYVRVLYEYLDRQGVDAAALLGEAAPEIVDRGLRRYPRERWSAMLELTARRLNDPLLGLRIGQTITTAHFGMMGYVLAACPQLEAAMARMIEYGRLLYETSPLHISRQGDELVFEWGLSHGCPGPLVDECWIASLYAIIRNIAAQPVKLTQVGFINPAPPDLQPYTDWFGCPVLFSQATTTVRFEVALLALPLRQSDEMLVRVLELQANALLAELPQTDDFEQAVRRCILQLIREGEPELEQVARELHVTERTLRRRLDDSGTNFRALREHIRHRMAEKYLLDPRLKLNEIAQLLGYSEPSTFTRAFKRWTGLTPHSYQQQILHGS
ncbi:AraC family transcriptional regulator [Collimonas pratensis]|uniref:Bacterial regulatory helix-turn-helix s, AraC family protein n=1 Tax=Collimonas pratensis TaxID=279113 RepID=A0ABM5Z6P9_9BURK|nr:AraC family transcriptional regulator [Collimonas pratensis]AMP14832.1 bacterial regulatory helix-turn-helix s, AraC family protein [Collimonas pratensis]